MAKVVAYGISWIPVNWIQSYLKTDWEILNYSKRQMTYEEVNKKKPEVIISYISPPTQLLENNTVKWMISPGAGVDILPISELMRKGITVINNHANSTAVAEQAWALLLAAAKKINKYDFIIRKQENWPDRVSQIKDFNSDLENKTLGIVGYGSIGKKIEKFATVFSMETIVFRRTPKENNQFAISDLLEQAENLDFLVIAYPLTKKSKGLISKDIIENLPSHSIVVNIARGELVDEEAMFDALREGKINAYSSDVWINSPAFKSDKGNPPKDLIEVPNLTISPHRAWVSKESFLKMAQQIANELDNIAQGIESSNIVDQSLEY